MALKIKLKLSTEMSLFRLNVYIHLYTLRICKSKSIVTQNMDLLRV